MAELLGRYKALTSSSSRSDVAAVLNSIILAPPSSFDVTTRGDLIKQILEDLKPSSKTRLQGQDAAKALLAVKTLGRDPAGSEVISQNMSAFLKFQSSLKDYPDATVEALRCLANALLLIESARHTFLDASVNGADVCVPLLEKAQTPDQIFILSRVLFLAAASGNPRIVGLVENKYNGKYLIDIVSTKIDSLIVPVQSSVPMAKDAMTDVLKFAFYILVHYPKLTDDSEPQTTKPEGDTRKVMGDFWSSKLDGLLGCTLRVFFALSPLSPVPIAAPLSHTIHALISIPVTPLRSTWFPQAGPSSSSNTPKSARTPHDSSRPASRSSSPARASPTAPKPSTLDRALSVLSRNRLSRSTSPAVTNPMLVVDKALELLDVTLARYFPGKAEADDPAVRDRVKADTPHDSLDELLSPLTILIARLAQGDDAARGRIRQFIVPDDLDRTSPLEEREDILGRCLRLLGSVYHARLKDTVGEMLFAMSDNNASTLSGLVGYGNVAGYLFNKGVMSAPPSSDSTAPTTTTKGEAINPITGTIFPPKKASASDDMTDEEKEREMEKLMVLFDRLEKTGALPKDQNPIRKGIQEGKLPIS